MTVDVTKLRALVAACDSQTRNPDRRVMLHPSELDELLDVFELRGEEVAKWAHESGTAKGQRDRLLAVFEAACAVRNRRLSIKSKIDRDDRSACDALNEAVDAAVDAARKSTP